MGANCCSRILIAPGTFGEFIHSFDLEKLDAMMVYWCDEQCPLFFTENDVHLEAGARSSPFEFVGTFFHKLYTNRSNQKVNALEILSACLCFCPCSLEKKVDWLWSIFDFQMNGSLTNTEMQLLIQSVSNGIGKAAKMMSVFSQEEVISFATTIYDSQNLRSSERISKFAFLSYLKQDIWAQQFIRSITNRIVIPKGPCTRFEAWRILTNEDNLPPYDYPLLLAMVTPGSVPATCTFPVLNLTSFCDYQDGEEGQVCSSMPPTNKDGIRPSDSLAPNSPEVQGLSAPISAWAAGAV